MMVGTGGSFNKNKNKNKKSSKLSKIDNLYDPTSPLPSGISDEMGGIQSSLLAELCHLLDHRHDNFQNFTDDVSNNQPSSSSLSPLSTSQSSSSSSSFSPIYVIMTTISTETFPAQLLQKDRVDLTYNLIKAPETPSNELFQVNKQPPAPEDEQSEAFVQIQPEHCNQNEPISTNFNEFLYYLYTTHILHKHPEPISEVDDDVSYTFKSLQLTSRHQNILQQCTIGTLLSIINTAIYNYQVSVSTKLYYLNNQQISKTSTPLLQKWLSSNKKQLETDGSVSIDQCAVKEQEALNISKVVLFTVADIDHAISQIYRW